MLHPHKYSFEFIKDDNAPQIFKALRDDLKDEAVRHGLDIETYRKPEWKNDFTAGVGADFCSHRATIRLVQIAIESLATVYVVDMKEASESVKALLVDYLQHGRFFAHNALFEAQFIQALGVKMLDVHCTMVMYRMLIRGSHPFPGKFKVDLKSAVKTMLNIDVSKEEQTSDWSADKLTESQIKYAIRDAAYTLRLGLSMLPKITKLMSKHYQINIWAINALARIIRTGIYFDRTDHNLLLKDWMANRELAEDRCYEVFEGINLRSGTQLAKWITENVDKELLDSWPKTEKGSLKTDSKTLEEYEGISGLTELCQFKMYQKLISTYGEGLLKFINPVTGRLHPSYTLSFTTTGRLSSRNPNIQNQPTRENSIRKYFRAQHKGSTLVCADYSQVEVRVAAILSKDKELIKAYKKGLDIYSHTASLVYKKPIDKISKKERQTMKAVVLGLQFGMGANKLAIYAKQYGVDMDERQAAEYVASYRKAYPGLYKWQIATAEKARKTLKTSTVCGMVRQLNAQNYYTCSMNTPVQGSAAEAMLMSIVILDNYILRKKLPARIVCTVHDEIVVECKEAVAQKVARLMENAMKQGFLYVFPDPKGCDYNLVEAEIGKTWEDVH